MSDTTEGVRRVLVEVINSNPEVKDELEEEYGKGNVFTTEEASEKFDFIGFMAPFVTVERKEDGVKGSLTFQDRPRFYFDFQKS